MVINVLKVGDNVINGDVKVPTIGIEKKIGQNASPVRVISEKVLAKIWLEKKAALRGPLRICNCNV